MKTMMKYLLSLILFLSASVSQAYVCDRLDIMGNDGLIQSFMVDDINKFTYLKDRPESDVYSTLHIELVTGATYDFSMKEISAIMYQGVSSNYLEIKCESDPHAPIVMLDCINNDHIMSQDKPLDWTAEKPNGKPHFDVRNEPGYVSEFEIVGQYTGNVYSDIDGFVFWDVKENNLLGVDAWAFYMPNEPVILRSTAMELNTYLGCEFLGKYTGYEFTASNGLLDKDNIPPLSMELKANGTCHIKSDDMMKYDFVDVYEYKQGANGFTHYVEELEEGESPNLEYRDQPVYGVNGNFLVNDYIVISIHDYNEDQHENTRIYVTGKNPFTYIAAFRSGDAYKGLVELKNQETGELTHVWMDNYGYINKTATLTFKKGASIGETSEALIAVDGQTVAKYVYTEGSPEPQIIMQGKEAGYYLPKGSEAGSIYFDGFGTVEIDGKTYSYVMESGVATVNYNGQERVFILDMDAMTYTEQVVSKWEGPEKYTNEAVLGCYAGGGEVAKQKVTLLIDQNLVGKEKIGYAALDIQIYGETKYISAVADCQKYIYNAEDNTLTLTTVLAGTGSNGTNRMTFVFQLSDDLQKIWLKDTGAGQKIYATSYDNSYVVLNQANALVAPQQSLPELSELYTASYSGTVNDKYATVEAKLWVGKDANGNAKAGYATLQCTVEGQNLINSCVPYVLTATKLTLKGVTVGDGNGGVKTADVAFTVTEDGRLVGRAAYHGVTPGTTVDLATASLVPEFTNAQLVEQYTGDFYLGASGYEAEVPSVVGTLYIDKTVDGILQPGYANLDFRLNGARFMSASVPYEVVGGKLILKNFGVRDTDSSDLVFEIGADGSLQATGKVYGTGSYTSCYVNMAKTKMTPVK